MIPKSTTSSNTITFFLWLLSQFPTTFLNIVVTTFLRTFLIIANHVLTQSIDMSNIIQSKETLSFITILVSKSITNTCPSSIPTIGTISSSIMIKISSLIANVLTLYMIILQTVLTAYLIPILISATITNLKSCHTVTVVIVPLSILFFLSFSILILSCTPSFSPSFSPSTSSPFFRPTCRPCRPQFTIVGLKFAAMYKLVEFEFKFFVDVVEQQFVIKQFIKFIVIEFVLLSIIEQFVEFAKPLSTSLTSYTIRQGTIGNAYATSFRMFALSDKS